MGAPRCQSWVPSLDELALAIDWVESEFVIEDGRIAYSMLAEAFNWVFGLSERSRLQQLKEARRHYLDAAREVMADIPQRSWWGICEHAKSFTF